MKKKNLKSLKLNKKSISKLNSHSVTGGWTVFTRLIADLIVDAAVSVANDFEGDCVQSWGDDGCPTHIDGMC